MNKNYLFLINGLGLGNSIRCYSIIQKISSHDNKISVVTSGNGKWFFSDKKEIDNIYHVDQIKYGNSGNNLSIAKTLLKTYSNLKTIINNQKIIKKIIKKHNPDVIIIDSFYYFNINRKIPIIAINNSDLTVELFQKYKNNVSFKIKLQFYFIELLDYLFHKTFTDIVISPTFDFIATNKIGNRIYRIAPIFRNEIGTNIKNNFEIPTCLFMLSGSIFNFEIKFKNKLENVILNIINSRGDLNKNNTNINYYPKTLNNIELINNSDLSIINAGYSAISDYLKCKKPMVIIPVDNHAEQWVNSKLIEEKKLGILANKSNYEEKLQFLIKNYREYQENHMNHYKNYDGAKQASNIILNYKNNEN